jgi:hypothetical protein
LSRIDTPKLLQTFWWDHLYGKDPATSAKEKAWQENARLFSVFYFEILIPCNL